MSTFTVQYTVQYIGLVVFHRHYDTEGRKRAVGEKGEVAEVTVEDEEEQREREVEEQEAVVKCRATIDRLCVKYGLHVMEWSHSEDILNKVGRRRTEGSRPFFRG